jgi:hypothetical protein
MTYIQIIIAAPQEDGPHEPPFIYFIKESNVTPEMLEEMEYQTGGYPYWCLQSEDPDDPSALCDIECRKFAIRVCPMGSKIKRLTITRCFYYRC